MDQLTSKDIELLIKVFPELYNDLLQSGVREFGKAIGNGLRFCFLPLSLLGTLADGINANLQHHLREYKRKLDKIPQDKIVEVPAQLAVPVIQKLSYTTNEEIANLFTNLLATASNKNTADQAHPGFESIISQLSPDEARIIQYLQNLKIVEYCDLRAYLPEGKGFQVLYEKATMIPARVNLDFPKNIHAYLSNLTRLGIIEDMSGLHNTDNTPYDEIKKANDFYLYDGLVPTVYKKIDIHKCYFSVTRYGRMFITACTDKLN